MRVLSLFDGMSCGQIALKQLQIPLKEYYASEIDKYAIKVTQKNFPNTIQLGDIREINGRKLPKIDLLMGGSPCQGFSRAGGNLNFEDPRSKLFFEFARLLKETTPKYFLLENVKMKKEDQEVISKILGVEPLEINSRDFGAQNRVRLYWTNLPVDLDFPQSKKVLKDIINSSFSDKTVKDTDRNLRHEKSLEDKSLCCTATMYKGAGNNGMTLIRRPDQKELSVLNVNEVEKLQNVPHNYTEGVSNTQRYKMLGNGWDVKVIKHLFKDIKDAKK